MTRRSPFRTRTKTRGLSHWEATRSRGFRLSQRLDPVLASLVVAVTLGVVLIALIFGGLRGRDMSEVPVPDKRILNSYTAEDGCFVKTATDRDGRVWTSLSDTDACQSRIASGGIAPYNPVWRTWGRQALPFQDDHGAIDPESLARLDEQLWVKGDAGGLANKGRRGDWRVWLSQSILEDNGRPVQQGDIAAIASIDDGKGLILATKRGQAARYDATTGHWQVLADLPGRNDIRQIVQLGGQLWVSRGEELWRLPLRSDGTRLGQPERVLEHPVRQLFAANEAIIAVTEDRCADGGVTCARVIAYTDGGSRGTTLFDSRQKPLGWTSEDVHFIAARDTGFVLAGPKGARFYDIVNRRWIVLERKPVRVFANLPNGTFALGGRSFVSLYANDLANPAKARFPNQNVEISGLAFDDDSRLHLSSLGGSLWVLQPDGKQTLRFRRTAPAAPQRASAILSDAATDLFITDDGAVAFDRATRRYAEIPESEALTALGRANLRHFEGNPVLAFASQSGGRNQLISVDVSKPEGALVADAPAGAPLNSLTQIDAARGLATNTEGRLFNIAGSGNAITISDAMGGQPRSGMDTREVRDVTVFESDLVLGGRQGIRRYDPERRVWTSITSSPVTSLAGNASTGRVLAVDRDNRLVSVSPSGTSRFVLGNYEFPFADDSQLFDALSNPEHGLVLLAGDGRGRVYLERYDPKRRVSETLAEFQLPRNEDAEILGFTSVTRWLVRIGGSVFTDAEEPLAKPSGRTDLITGWQEQDSGAIVTLHRDIRSGHQFLFRLPENGGQATCLYRGAAFFYDESSQLRALPNGNLAALRAEDVQVYDAAARRWYQTSLPSNSGPFEVISSKGALWATPRDGGGSKRLWRIVPDAPSSGPDSCDVGASPLPAPSYDLAAVDMEGDRILHMPQPGTIVETNTRTQRTSRLFSAPVFPRRYTRPLRAMLDDGFVWLAFSNGIMRYDIAEREWTELARFSSRNWSQVTLSRVPNPGTDSIIANYGHELFTRQVAMPANATNIEATTVLDHAVQSIPALPSGTASLDVVDAWADGPRLAFRTTAGLLIFNRDIGAWTSGNIGLTEADDVVGEVANSLLTWSPSQRRFRYQAGRSRSDAYQNPRVTNPVPATARALVTRNGRPAYVTEDGAYVLCADTGECIEQHAAPPVFDLDLVSSGFDLGSGFLLLGADGNATFLDTRTRQFRRLFAPPPFPSQRLDLWLDEPFLALWPAKNGNGFMVASRNREWSRINQRGPLRAPPPSVLAGEDIALFNPDEGVGLTEGGEVGWRFRKVALPSELGIDDLVALGRHAGRIWFQTEREVLTFPEQCIVDPSEALQTDCAGSALPVPGGTVAYFDGDWSDDAPLVAQLTNGSRASYDGVSWQTETTNGLENVDVDTELRALLAPRPDGELSLFASAEVLLEEDERITINVPGIGRLNMIDPTSLSMPPLDLGWLVFDRGEVAFDMSGTTGTRRLSGRDVFDATGAFRPFIVRSALTQTDGNVLAETLFGFRVLGVEQSPFARAPEQSIFFANRAPSSGDRLDEGGLWQGQSFVAMGENENRVPAVSQTEAAFSIQTDLRRPGVRLSHGDRAAWQNGSGFLWDRFSDLGWSDGGQSVMETPLGALVIGEPFGAEVAGPINWSGQSFARLQRDDEMVPPAQRYVFAPPDGPTFGALPTDTILSAGFVNQTALLGTGRGLQRLTSFGYADTFEGGRAPVLDVSVHRPTGLAVVVDARERRTVTGGREPARDPTRQERLALASPLQAEIGPLRLFRRVSYSLRLADHETSNRSRPAFVSTGQNKARFAFDTVANVVAAADGTIAASTPVGHVVLPEGEPDLNALKLYLADTAMTALDTYEFGGVRLAVGYQDTDALACRILEDGELRPQCPPNALQTRLEVETALGPLQTQRIRDDVSFTLLPKVDSGPLPITFEDGRFDSDRVTHVAACHGFIHYFLRAGLHLRQEISDPDWTSAEPIALRSVPRRVHCPEGLEQEILPNYLIAEMDNDAEGNVLDDSVPTRLATNAAIARYTEGPALPKTPVERSRVFRVKEGVSSFEMATDLSLVKTLRIGGQETPLRFVGGLGPGLEIDIPRAFLVIEGRYWAATNAGLVPMGETDGQSAVRLEIEGPPVFPFPAACGRVERIHWINATTSELFCDNAAFRISGLGDGNLKVLSDFPVHSQVARQGALAITARQGKGIQNMSLAGELLALADFDNGFAFDTDISLAPAFDGDLMMTSNHGFIYFNGRSLSLATDANEGIVDETRLVRIKYPELRRAVSLHMTEDPRTVCVSYGNTSAPARIDLVETEEGILTDRRSSGACPTFQATDNVREAWFDTEGETVFLFRFDNTTATDTMEDGRFRSDSAKDLPKKTMHRSESGRTHVFCAPSANPQLAIAGDSLAARQRVPLTSCREAREPESAHADNNLFFVEDGILLRRRLP